MTGTRSDTGWGEVIALAKCFQDRSRLIQTSFTADDFRAIMAMGLNMAVIIIVAM
jgi:hypothetical protein